MIKIIGDVHSKTGDYKRLVRSMEPGQRSIQVGDMGLGFRDVDEFAFRLNEGKVSRHTLDRLASFVDLVSGCRITHEQLTKGKTWFDAEEAV